MNRQRLPWVVGLTALLAIGGLWADYLHTIDGPLENRESVYFEISKGQSLSSIAEALRERGLTSRPRWFRLLAWIEKSQSRLKFGEYEIRSQTTPAPIAGVVRLGQGAPFQPHLRRKAGISGKWPKR